MKARFNLIVILVCAISAGMAVASPLPAVWIDVPYLAQTRDGCGSASIAMVMQYWDAKAGRSAPLSSDAARIQQALFSPKEGGIPSIAMQKYFAANSYRVFAFRGTWQDLASQIEQGRPLIVTLRASPLSGALHYVVVVGIDPERNYVFVNDPAQQKMLRISRDGFESEWNPTHNWTLLAVPLSGD